MRTNNKFADIENLRPSTKHPYKAIVAGILAGSLVAAMLFLGSCANMKSMEQIYPQSVVQMLEENGYTSQDYDAKKQEFLNADPGNLDCGLQIVPHNYYKERFGLTDQEISERVFGAEVFFVDNSLYVAGKYVPTLEKLGIVKEGEDWNNNPDVLDTLSWYPSVIGTLFKYDLEPEVYEALKSAYTATDRVSNGKTIDKDKYTNQVFGRKEIIKGEKIMTREDRVNNFQYRYLLDTILSSYTPTVLGSEVYNATSAYYVRNNKDDTTVIDKYMMAGYPFIEDGYLYVHFIGMYKNDPKMEKYLFRASVKLDGQDLELINKNSNILDVPCKLTDLVSNAKKTGKTVYYYPVGKCDIEPTNIRIDDAVARIHQDFYEHGGRPESLDIEHRSKLK